MTEPIVSVGSVHRSYLMGGEAVSGIRSVSLEIERGGLCLIGSKWFRYNDPAADYLQTGRCQQGHVTIIGGSHHVIPRNC